ncbi:Neutral endopeptidase [Austwickia sp. TVS 96-490-7B]|nr:M13-type metalloendopeptidase [Austwickia sp. TVS 96-490-7B]MBW3085534.1 Neutral endopeptidase [Austwickia sp. TVS 96-490-7B]
MRSGIVPDQMDTAVRPQDDLYGYVNGGWLADATIPQDRSSYGTFDILRERAEFDMRALLEESGDSDGASPAPGTLARRLYAAFLDEQRADQLGITPIADLLAQADQVDDGAAAMVLLGRLQRYGVGGLVEAYVDTDRGQPDRYVTYLEQAGIGLPDESFYREEEYAQIREAYVAHVTRTFVVAGMSQAAAEADAAAVMTLETALAAGHWDNVACRDVVKSYTLTDLSGLEELAGAVPWRAWLDALGAPESAATALVTRQPSALQALSEQISAVAAPVWRAWVRWMILHAYSPYLTRELSAESFDFYGRVLSGIPEQRDRWRRGVALVNDLVGEDAGQLYVARHFPAHASERMSVLVDNLIEAYRRDIRDLAWMTPDTRERALAKLDSFTAKIGHPQRWRDYSGLKFDADDLVGAVQAAQNFEADRMWAKLDGPVDRDEWFMNAQTVNAYYNPGMNEIVFPAGILQPPFFDVDADDAVNYGAIGAVIGHEIGHGFDDQGSRYDGRGELVDWWTAEDRAAFDERAQALIVQYDGFHPRNLPDEKVNGALTVGENIGDLGGVTIAHLAYRISLAGHEAPVIDGLTGDQRFFAGWAQIWRIVSRPEEAKRRLALDPHSPGEFRANIVRNLTEFHDAFEVREGDELWLPEDRRVRIW